jgi:hypothetical protein
MPGPYSGYVGAGYIRPCPRNGKETSETAHWVELKKQSGADAKELAEGKTGQGKTGQPELGNAGTDGTFPLRCGG